MNPFMALGHQKEYNVLFGLYIAGWVNKNSNGNPSSVILYLLESIINL